MAITPSTLREALHAAAHLLPQQAPIARFVHHNTLHAFEDLVFEEAVVAAGAIFEAEPFPTEARCLEYMAEGLFGPRHIEVALREEGVDEAPVFDGGPSRRALRGLRLVHPAPLSGGPSIAFLAAETALLREAHPGAPVSSCSGPARRAALEALFERARVVADAQRPSPAGPLSPRLRDLLVAEGVEDPDERVNPILGRSLAAYLDQGVAHVEMPERELGYYGSLRSRYAHTRAPDRFGGALRDAMRDALSRALDAEALALEELGRLGLSDAELPAFIERTILALPGWGGILDRLVHRPDLAPIGAPRVELMELLGVRLVLDRLAAEAITGRPIAEARAIHASRAAVFLPRDPERFALDLFVMAQLAGVSAGELRGQVEDALVAEVNALGELVRRRLYQRAFEAAFLEDTERSIAAHLREGPAPSPSAPDAQMVFCIDDREESFRRHLEEVGPNVETLAYAGFYDLAIRHHGFGQTRPDPLCPMPVTPTHRVIERSVEPSAGQAFQGRRRMLGGLFHGGATASRTLFRGAAASLAGPVRAAPVALRTIAPRTAARLLEATRSVAAKPKTEIVFEKHADNPEGFTVPEMTAVVESVLRQMGLVSRFAPLVVFTGHGSSSVNNPYTAAYNCGACAGHRGGPNGRTFAAMANHAEVRAALAAVGIVIPPTTHFVGAYHDTASDALTFFDVDRVPPALQEGLEKLRRIVDIARARNAHERCRRFEHIGLGASPEQALAHVEARVADLGQPRPELGHANNALYIIGRRALTRGLFLDRRAFLSSYDPTTDPDGTILQKVIAGGVPVCAGISLEYFFSAVDPMKYGCGTKLPQNVSGLLGVMDGHGGDLRTGLPTQMIEIHEPLRLVCVVEAKQAVLQKALAAVPGSARLVKNRWTHLYALDPDNHALSRLVDGDFVPCDSVSATIDTVHSSADWYRGERRRLTFARVIGAEKGSQVQA